MTRTATKRPNFAEPTALSDSDIARLVHEGYALHHLLFNLGFSADEVYAGSALIANTAVPGLHAVIVLRAQGLEWVYTLARLNEADELRFCAAWARFSEAQPKANRAELDALVEASEVRQQRVRILFHLTEKGFVFPFDVAAGVTVEPSSAHDVN